MRQYWKKWVGSLGIAFLLASCASTAHIKKDEHADFSKYRTFAWIEKSDKSHSQDLTEQKVRKAVNKELERTAGWKESTHKPDILLSYDVLVERSGKEQNDPVYSYPFTRSFYSPYSRRFITVYYPSEFMGYNRYDVPIREGTITITMIDEKTNKTVWQGWTTDEVNSKNLTNKEIQSAVHSIFRKFDVAKK